MLQISIGRNIGKSLPLVESEWLLFQQAVEEAVMVHTLKGIADTKANGVSHWQGVSEDTCIFVWFDIEALPLSLKFELKNIAKQYGQDAIAVTFGETEFIG
jgi:hypothetical protein